MQSFFNLISDPVFFFGGFCLFIIYSDRDFGRNKK